MARNPKDYSIRQVQGDVVSIEAYREAPWIQTWAKKNYDFRRWLYIGRPKLDYNGQGSELMHAGRDQFVAALKDAVWDIPDVTEKTKQSYCRHGLVNFFEFLDSRHKTNPITCLEQIDEIVLEDYLHWLRHIKEANTETGRLGGSAPHNIYTFLKAVLQHFVYQQALPENIFPINPFPNYKRAKNSHKPYSREVMLQLLNGLAKDIRGLRKGTLKLSPKETLTVFLLMIAARSGRNPSPLMNATRDALQPHPLKPKEMMILQVFKNRGNTTNIQGFRIQKEIKDHVSVSLHIYNLFNEVSAMTASLIKDAPKVLQNKLWLYRNIGCNRNDGVKVMDNYHHCTQNIVNRHGIKDDDGKPLKLNISRLRATFVNAMWRLSKGDLATTAKRAGNTEPVTDRNYLAKTPESMEKFHKLGIFMHAQLAGKLEDPATRETLCKQLGVTDEQLDNIERGKYDTGVGRCRDPLHGAMAPGDGTFCNRWLGCFYCPDQIVMESDLYRLYSFYFLLIKERRYLQPERWDEVYGPIISIIDNEIVNPNLQTLQNPRGCFDPLKVKRMKEKAEHDPHPMWRNRDILILKVSNDD